MDWNEVQKHVTEQLAILKKLKECFGETEAFSAEIILKRTKTLMQGDDHCDHCYIRKK